MNPDDLLKVAPTIAKGAGALAAAIPFTAIVKKMLGPAADELAEMWKDRVRLYRYERQVKCVEKAGRMAKEAGFTPKAVPIKLLFPLLEGASFEEDDSLHDMWAALLANASLPDGTETVRPSFIASLKQMAPDEARLLTAFSEYQYSIRHHELPQFLERINFGEEPKQLYSLLSIRFLVCWDGLKAAGLAEDSDSPADYKTGRMRTMNEGDIRIYALTERGKQFMTVCQPPKPKS